MKKLPPWFINPGEGGDVIIGSMARIVRNLEGHAYPGWSTEEGRKAVAAELLPRILNLPGNKTAAFCVEMSELDYIQRRVLLERKLISQCMAARQSGCHIVINGKQDTTFMVNEEEHLVMHLFSTSQEHKALIQRGKKICNTLGKELKFATSSTGDQLTSLPTETGSGIQLYTVMQLPALLMADMMPQITRGLEKLLLNIAPLYSNLGDDAANLFVVYTAPIAQGGEDEIAEHLLDVVQTIAQREHEVRARLANNAETMALLPDAVSRAYGLMRYSYRLEHCECLNAISMIRLGLVAGYIEPVFCEAAQYIGLLATYYLETAPYHMLYVDPSCSETAQEMARAAICKQIISDIELHIEIFDQLSDLIIQHE